MSAPLKASDLQMPVWWLLSLASAEAPRPLLVSLDKQQGGGGAAPPLIYGRDITDQTECRMPIQRPY